MLKLYRNRVKNWPKGQIAVTSHGVHVEYALALPKRAEFVARYLAQLNAIFVTFFADENFLTLLRAESITTVPLYLKPLLDRSKGHTDEPS